MDKYKKIVEKLLKNKYVLILLALGLILMLFAPGNGDNETKTDYATSLSETVFSVEKLEKRLGDALSKIDGAGKVKVLLTVKSSTEQVIAEDQQSTERLGGDEIESESSNKTVIIDVGDKELPVTLKYIYPKFQGALIIAEGADSTSVRLALTEAVASLTGIGSDKITVTKMQS